MVTLADDHHRERIFVSDLFHVMEDSAAVALILLFALPNLVPVPPGTSTILGTPLLFLTIEWTLGKRPWLPGMLARRSMSRIKFASMVHRAAPWMERVDRFLKPRLSTLACPSAARPAAALCAVLALIIVLPIPLGNMPPAWAICLIALGMLRRDGIWVLAGVATGLASIALVWGVLAASVTGTLELLRRLVN